MAKVVNSEETNSSLALDWLICHLRWLWLILAFFIAQLSQVPGTNLTFVYILLGAGVIYNGIVLALLFIGWYPSWVTATIAVFDTLLAVALLWATGGYASAMLPILLFVVVTIALRINPESGLLSATIMALAYAASIISANATAADNLSDVSTKAFTLFVAAGVAGYINRQRLRHLNNELEREVKKLRVENERAKAIYEMANTLGSTLNYRKVLRAMVDLAYMALSEANKAEGRNPIDYDQGIVGMVLLFEETGALGKLKIVAGRNIPRLDDGKKITTQEGILAQAIYKAEAYTTNNVQNDPDLKQFVAFQRCQSAVVAPLRAGFDTYGLVLFASPHRNFYTADHANLLVTFCNQAIIALQNAQLYADLELEQKKLLEKEAAARRELARNLHDGPTQAIASIAMRLNFVKMVLKREGDLAKAQEELDLIEQIANRTTQEIRTMLFTLRPVVLETQGLGAALYQYADRLRDLDGMNIELDVDGYDGRLSTEQEGVLFTIIEEAVGNAKKHGQARQVQIRLGIIKDHVVAEVADDGVGFDIESVKSNYDQRGSLGLINMDERSQMLGGQCRIVSAVGKGTTVRLEVPPHKNGGSHR